LAFLGTIRTLAGEGPILAAVDDLQWLDAPTLALLRFALARLEVEPVAALLTVRGEVPRWLRDALPEYPSAHNCLAGALGTAASEIVGSREIGLDVSSIVTGTTRHYDRVDDFDRDIVDARVFVGYHWRTSDEVGFELGSQVAHWAANRYFEQA
jgi:hypothetical protein